MFNRSDQLFTNVFPTTWYGSIIQFPLTRILIALLFLIPVTLLAQILGPNLYSSLSEPFHTILRYSRDFISLILFMICYSFYTRFVERRITLEFSFKKFINELGVGFLFAFALVSLIVFLLTILGYYQVESTNSILNLSNEFTAQMMVAFTEELIFRIILFKLVEEFAGSWIALIVQGLLFGFAHIGNPNASLWTSLGLVIATLLLFGCAFILTRRIWLVMGLHWGWNVAQSGFYGLPNSGNTVPSLINPTVTGPDWITGGAFGIEASYISLAFLVVTGAYLLKKAIDDNQLVEPMWKRKQNGIETKTA